MMRDFFRSAFLHLMFLKVIFMGRLVCRDLPRCVLLDPMQVHVALLGLHCCNLTPWLALGHFNYQKTKIYF